MELDPKNGVYSIAKSAYWDHLPELKHVFLTGNLRLPTPYPFVRDDRLEILVCKYETGDVGLHHWHDAVTEYEWVVEGELGYFDVAKNETYWFNQGDLVIIPPRVCVRRLLRRHAITIAIKVPSLSEKVHCPECDRECSHRTHPYKGV